jgi:hypothetical protein
LSIFVALLARARPLRVSPSTHAFKNQQLLFSGHHEISLAVPPASKPLPDSAFWWREPPAGLKKEIEGKEHANSH